MPSSQKPNEHLLHPSAFTSSENSRTPLYAHQVLAYEGHVLPAHLSSARLLEDQASGVARSDDEEAAAGSLGWARLLVHDAAEGIMTGAFVVDGVIHHVLRSDTYARLKEDHEPEPEDGEPIVIFRDGLDDADVGSSSSARAGMGCSHDHLEFNSDPSHAVLQNRVRQASPWWAEHSIASRFEVDVRSDRDLGFTKRQDFSAGGMTQTNSK